VSDPQNPCEANVSCQQQKMRFEDADKYIRDGVEYTVTYEASGIVTCAAPEEEVKIPEPGQPDWVSYTMKFTVARPAHNIKFRAIKVSPHSKAGKALVKKNDPK